GPAGPARDAVARAARLRDAVPADPPYPATLINQWARHWLRGGPRRRRARTGPRRPGAPDPRRGGPRPPADPPRPAPARRGGRLAGPGTGLVRRVRRAGHAGRGAARPAGRMEPRLPAVVPAQRARHP